MIINLVLSAQKGLIQDTPPELEEAEWSDLGRGPSALWTAIAFAIALDALILWLAFCHA
jgi:hypothetical protein